MTRWWWVRHGPTHQKNFTGWRDVDVDLSDTAKIARLNDHLPDGAVLVSSDLKRAVKTADALGGSHSRLPHASDMREFNFGLWDGLHFEEVAKRDPELSRAYWENPGDVAPPEGESWNDAAGRLNRFVDQMNDAHWGRDIIAVAHFGAILTQVQRGLGVSAYEALSHEIENLSVTQMTWDGQDWSVQAINHSV